MFGVRLAGIGYQKPWDERGIGFLCPSNSASELFGPSNNLFYLFEEDVFKKRRNLLNQFDTSLYSQLFFVFVKSSCIVTFLVNELNSPVAI